MGNAVPLTDKYIGIAHLTQKNVQLVFIVTFPPENSGYFSSVLSPEKSSSEDKQKDQQKEDCIAPSLSTEETA